MRQAPAPCLPPASPGGGAGGGRHAEAVGRPPVLRRRTATHLRRFWTPVFFSNSRKTRKLEETSSITGAEPGHPVAMDTAAITAAKSRDLKH